MEGKGTLRFLTFITIAIFIMALVLFFKKPEQPEQIGYCSYEQVDEILQDLMVDFETQYIVDGNFAQKVAVDEEGNIIWSDEGFTIPDENGIEITWSIEEIIWYYCY